MPEFRKPLCIYHGNCADGFTAAWAVWKRFGNAWDYHPGVYQNEPPDAHMRDVVFVDFSYKRDVMKALRKRATSMLVLDHHKSAAEDLAYQGGNFGIDLSKYTGALTWERHFANVQQDIAEGVHDSVYCLFDMERSGAGISWDFFHPDKPRHSMVSYVEDRDLWRFKLPQSRDFSANLFSLPYDFHVWDRVAKAMEDQQKRQAFLDEGAAIERKHHKDVAELVSALRREMIIGGHWVPVANLPYTLTSDAGHLMCAPYQSPHLQGEIVTPPFAACYWDTTEGRVFSLRSIEGGADVSEIAKQYGGGGHKHAAGFRLPHGSEP